MTRIRAAVVLAAGRSSRMGSPKALLQLGGRPVVLWHCTRLGAFADQVVVVVGASADPIRAVLPADVAVVENPDWATTMPIDSLVCALRTLETVGSVLVTPVDVVPARPETVSALIAADGLAVPVDARGDPGHPVLLDAASVAAIRDRPPAGGLRTVLAAARRVPVEDPLVTSDFDDPAAWRVVLDGWRRT